MNAFETELGCMSEIAEAVNDMGWLLPTDIQSDSIPLILGGGDVLMAAETGTGKTGAFCLPILQIVYETLKDLQEHRGVQRINTPSQAPKGSNSFTMSAYDRTGSMAIDSTGSLCQSRDEVNWHGCRCTKGVLNKGKYVYEAEVTDEGLCRVGFSTQEAALELGCDRLSFGFGGTGKKSFNKQFDTYGEPYGINDIIGCLIDLDNMKIRWAKNGVDFGEAYTIQANIRNCALYPSVCLKNAEMRFNFGETPFKFNYAEGYIPICQASKENSIVSPRSSGNTIQASSGKRANNAPLALIIEPSKELAEQTHNQLITFMKHLKSPSIKAICIVGGVPLKSTMNELESGGCVDIIVATPGRLDDLINTNRVSLEQVRFFVLDEVDGLLKQGHRKFITNTHGSIPPASWDGKRLQMIVASATLHDPEVAKLAEQLMHFPAWIDLKGQDSVPDTIHHCVCIIDPKEDISWRNLKRHVTTDNMHQPEQLNYNSESREMLSEAVKILKGEYCVRAIHKFQMERALIFCRTKLDCDNLEQYLISMGGGPRAGGHHALSCVCLHSDRSPQDRNDNLARFKDKQVRLLICTDVAARGLDINGLPFVINYTLPDDVSNYVHRIGRVGRADRMGLAISLVSRVQEKVWYHTCLGRGKGCNNRDRRLVDDGGCCIWYDEMSLLEDVEDHLGCTITQIPNTFEVPINEIDGKVTYGEKRKAKVPLFKGHVEQLASSVHELIALETKTQITFLNMRYNKSVSTIQ